LPPVIEHSADRIIVLGRVVSRLELARAFGADHALSQPHHAASIGSRS